VVLEVCTGDTILEELEKEARDTKKCLLVDPAPIPPWVYRQARRGQAPDVSDFVPLESKTETSLGCRASRRPTKMC
jgi:hypothetical protein